MNERSENHLSIHIVASRCLACERPSSPRKMGPRLLSARHHSRFAFRPVCDTQLVRTVVSVEACMGTRRWLSSLSVCCRLCRMQPAFGTRNTIRTMLDDDRRYPGRHRLCDLGRMGRGVEPTQRCNNRWKQGAQPSASPSVTALLDR
jgi:hypothetical protein